MTHIKASSDLFRVIENNILFLNDMLTYWCGETISYNLLKNLIEMDVDILRSILRGFNIILNKETYVPGKVDIVWDPELRVFTVSKKHNNQLIGYDKTMKRSVTCVLSADWSSSHEFIPEPHRSDILLQDVTSNDFYIVEWKDLNISLIKKSLERSKTNIDDINFERLKSLSKKYPYFYTFFTYIPILHQSFLELSDPKRFIFYGQTGSILFSDTTMFHWQVLDFSKPMILDCSVKENTYKLWIPSITFSILFML